MFQITDDASRNNVTINLFDRAVKIAGLTLPKFDPSTVPAPDIIAATPDEISAAVHKAVAAGKDPLADKGVQQLMMRKLLVDQVGGFHYRNQLAITKAQMEHIKAHAPALLEQMDAEFTAAVGTMQEQIPVIGHRDLKHAVTEIDRVPERVAAGITTAFRALSKATATIEALPYILEAVGVRLPSGGHNGLLTYCKPTHQQFIDHRLSSQSTQNNHGRPHNVWDLLNDGITIELATTNEEFQARLQRLEQGRNAAGRDHRKEASQRGEAKEQARMLGFS